MNGWNQLLVLWTLCCSLSSRIYSYAGFNTFSLPHMKLLKICACSLLLVLGNIPSLFRTYADQLCLFSHDCHDPELFLIYHFHSSPVSHLSWQEKISWYFFKCHNLIDTIKEDGHAYSNICLEKTFHIYIIQLPDTFYLKWPEQVKVKGQYQDLKYQPF